MIAVLPKICGMAGSRKFIKDRSVPQNPGLIPFPSLHHRPSKGTYVERGTNAPNSTPTLFRYFRKFAKF